jgi:hypothetical protein
MQFCNAASREKQKLAAAEMVSDIEGNMCGAASTGRIAPAFLAHQ